MLHRHRLKIRFMAACATNLGSGWTDLSTEDQDKLATELERGCYNVAIETAESAGIYCNFDNLVFVSQYSLICDRVGSHLDATSSVGPTNLLARLLAGEVEAVNVARLKSEELWPEASADVRRELETRSRQGITPKTSQRYTCKKCQGTETLVREYQSRAGDEASTTSVKCARESCGHTWRIH